MDRFIELVRNNPLQAAVISFFLLVVFLAWRIELGGHRHH